MIMLLVIIKLVITVVMEINNTNGFKNNNNVNHIAGKNTSDENKI